MNEIPDFSSFNENERFKWLDWKILSEFEKEMLLSRLAKDSDFDATASPDQITIRKAELSFYIDTFLIELTDKRKGFNHRTEFLYKTQKKHQIGSGYHIEPLNRTSLPIHFFNDEIINLRLSSKNYAVEYLRFFTEAIEGDEGPFYLIDTPENIPGHIKLEDIERIKEEFPEELKEEILERIQKTETAYEVEVVILYHESIFKCKMIISENGFVEMEDDDHFIPNLSIDILSKYQHFVLLLKDQYGVLDGKNLTELMSRETSNELANLIYEKYLEIKDKIEELREHVSPTIKIIGDINFVGNHLKFPFNLYSYVDKEDVSFRFDGNLNFSYSIINHSLDLSYCDIYGKIDLSHSIVKGSIFIENTKITPGIFEAYREAALNLRHCRIKGNVFIKNAEISNGYSDLSFSNIQGILDLDNSIFDKYLICYGIKIGVILSLNGAIVAGSVSLSFATVSGGVFARLGENNKRTNIEGDFTLSGIYCPGHIELVGAIIKGRLLIISPKEMGSLYLNGKAIGKSIFTNFYRCMIGWGIFISNAELKGNFHCRGLQVGKLDSISSEYPKQGNFELHNCSIRGNLSFFDPNLIKEKFLFLIGIENKLFRLFKDFQLGEENYLITVDSILKAKSINLFASNFRELIDLKPDNIVEYVRFYYSVISPLYGRKVFIIEERDDLSCSNLIFEEVIEEISAHLVRLEFIEIDQNGCFILKSSIIENDLLFKVFIIVDPNAETLEDHIHYRKWGKYSVDLTVLPINLVKSNPYLLFSDQEELANPWQKVEEEDWLNFFSENFFSYHGFFPIEVASMFYIELDFFKDGRLIAIGNEWGPWLFPTQISRSLKLNNVKVSGNFDISNLHIVEEFEISNSSFIGDIRSKSSKLVADNSNLSIFGRSSCSNFSMEVCEIRGNIHLSSLRVIRREDYQGDLKIINSNIDGILELSTINYGTKEICSEINGQLNLSGSSVDRIIMDGKSFPKDIEQKPIKKKKINLGRSKKGKIKGSVPNSKIILEGLECIQFDWKGEVPKKVNLKNLQVQSWNEIGISKLLDFLKADSVNNFSRKTYTTIERFLQNEGHEEKAEKVYRLMWKKIRTQKISDKRPSHFYRLYCSLRSSFGYGNRPAIRFILFISLPTLLLSLFFIFNNPNNVLPSFEELGATNTKEIPPGVSPKNWKFIDGFWLTAKYHLPIIPIDVRSDWKPDHRNLEIDLSSINFHWKTERISAEDWAGFVTLIHWIIIPIVIIAISGIIRRVDKIF